MSQTNLLGHLTTYGNPIIDDDLATFVWLGDTHPHLIGEFNNWGWQPNGKRESAAMTEVENGVWVHTTRLPRDAYIEYYWAVDLTNDKKRAPDPHNPHKITNGIGDYNHYFAMPDWKPTPLTRVKKGVPRGKISHFDIKQVAPDFYLPKRDVWLYAPPTDAPVPLVVVWDGRDYLRRAKLTEIVDNLIHEGKIQPIAIAMIDNAREYRMVEYMSCEMAVLMVGQYVIPHAQKELNLLDIDQHPGSYGILGASMGGLMAMYAALRLPQIFGRVISQSGAFLFEVRPGQDDLFKFLVKTQPPLKAKIWQDVGRFEWLLETNRQTRALLTERGYDVTYHEYQGGHNYTSWRNVLPQALMTVFGV